IDELADHGYAGMSVDSVAQRAGVGKASIYRRYQDKADLVTAAIAAQKRRGLAPTDLDTARESLVAILDRTRERMIDDGHINTLIQILAESERNPKLIELHRERTIAERRAEFESVVDFGVERGELRADFDRDLVFEQCIGAWLSRYAVGNNFDDSWAEDVVALLWPAIAAR
ncbi:MAG: TetR/AcrR family transcriptional regulator, partial [Solirubrobacterales bacterium]